MIIIPQGLTPQEIRVLQEFRRLAAETLSLEQVNAIRHPAGGGEAPAVTLVAKGFLTAADGSFTITPQGKEFLAIEAFPDVAESREPAGSAAADVPAESP